MSCCGGSRRQLRTTVPLERDRRGPVQGRATAFIRYRGSAAVSVTGPVTHRLYRFAHAGAVVAVDRRDAPHLARLPQFQELRHH